MWKDMDNMRLQLHKGEMDHCKQCGQQLDSQTVAIHYKTHLDSLEKDMAHYYNKQNKNKKAHRSHPEKRKRSECGEELDYNKIYKQDNSVSHCIPSGLPKSTLAQFNNNMRVHLDEGEMEDCKECGQQLDSQTMSIHYKIHYDSLQKDMAHYYNKIYKSTKQHNSVSDCIRQFF